MTRHLHLIILTLILTCASVWAAASTPIRGPQEADVERMYQYVAAHNPLFPRETAQAFYEIGELYGVRGDIALCQAIIETGWFRFDNGTAVPASAHNYCGLGVHSRGEKGCKFDTMRDGVTAMIQHLYAYACKERIPEGERVVDPRFSYVSRGCAESWESLSGKWAMNSKYGEKILSLYRSMLNHEVKSVEIIEVNIPDHLIVDLPDGEGSDEDERENNPFFK